MSHNCLACLSAQEGGEDLLGYPGPEHHTACVYYRANRPGPASTPPARRRTPAEAERRGAEIVNWAGVETQGLNDPKQRFVDRLTDVSDKAGRYAVKTPVPPTDAQRGVIIQPSQARARSTIALQRLGNALGVTLHSDVDDCVNLERLALQAERWRQFDQLVSLANSTRTRAYEAGHGSDDALPGEGERP